QDSRPGRWSVGWLEELRFTLPTSNGLCGQIRPLRSRIRLASGATSPLHLIDMNTKDFMRLGVPLGEATRRATDFVAQYVLRGGNTAKLEDEIKAIVANPTLFAEDP